MSKIITNLSGIWPKYTIKPKSPCNFINRSLLNDDFSVVWAVNNVKGLHAFFKRVQWSEKKENSIKHIAMCLDCGWRVSMFETANKEWKFKGAICTHLSAYKM